MYFSRHDYVDGVLDEISLEGLDGITIEGLWTRLNQRPGFSICIDKHGADFLWNIIVHLKDVEMFELEQPRKPLVIFNRYDYLDPELGVVLEPKELPEDPYPHFPINDAKSGIRGSCATYKSRNNVTLEVRKMKLDEALQRWENKLVLVASQEARENALMGKNVDPNLELTVLQYCVLERIGRSRYLGEVTQGKVSLQRLGESPKALFYHRKYLGKHKLITKQVHHLKTGFQNCSGSLLQLPRFYVERKPKAIYFTEKIIGILKQRPNCLAEYEEIRKAIGYPNVLKKLCKTSDFQRVIKTDLRLPYRELYPEATRAEWKHKGSDKERVIRVLKLVNPEMDVRDLWSKDDEQEEESDHLPGVLDTRKLVLDRSLMSQAIKVLDDAGPEGLSQMELSRTLGVTKLQSRTLCRNLLKKDVVATYMNDVGRQRVCRYISKKFDKDGKYNVEFKREKEKMMKLVGKKLPATQKCETEKRKGKKVNVATSQNEEEMKENGKCGEGQNQSDKAAEETQVREIQGNDENENKENKINVERTEKQTRGCKINVEESGKLSTTNMEQILQKAFTTNGKTVLKVSKEALERLKLVCAKETLQKAPKNMDTVLQTILGALDDSCTLDESPSSQTETSPSVAPTKTEVNEPVNPVTSDKTNSDVISDDSGNSTVENKKKRPKLLIPPRSSESNSNTVHAKRLKRRAIFGKNEAIKKSRIFHNHGSNFALSLQRSANISPHALKLMLLRKQKKPKVKRPRIVCKHPLEVEPDENEPEFKKPKPLPIENPTENPIENPTENPTENPIENPNQDKRTLDSIHTEVIHLFKNVPEIKRTTTGFTADVFSSAKRLNTPNVTYRLLRRANLIIESVRKHKVIHDYTKLMKYIKEEEAKEGCMAKIDKKSLLRLLHRLSVDGHLKILKTVLRSGEREKLLHFVCEPGITSDHTVIQSAIEQAKLKMFVPPKTSKSVKERDQACDDLASTNLKKSPEKEPTEEKVPTNYVYNNRIGKKYGFAPKFVRMQTMHHFLFYVVYCYEGIRGLNQETTIRKLKAKGHSFTADDIREMSTIYVPEVSWKMFVPPLPAHEGWPRGWAIMSDILLRLPLSVFMKLVNVSYIVPELEAYLLHPIKRFLLVRNLPTRMRNVLMMARRYIFTIHETVQRLCFVGLIQFGPQRLKEKDQVFVYVNHKASLLDTTPSKPGYHQISDDIDYVQHKYEFRKLGDIENYWYEMWNICIHTQLGGRMCVTGKDIVLEILANKQAMIEAVQPVVPQEAAALDLGQIPGDKKGAAGLDSAIFAHLKRNWNWTNTPTALSEPSKVVVKPKAPVQDQRKARLASLKKQPIKLDEIYPNAQIQNKSGSVVARKRKRTTKPKDPKLKDLKAKDIKAWLKKETGSGRTSKKKNIIRHVLPRKNRTRSKPYYDEVDKKALQLMSKLRVDWSTSEDNFLLLCKVASMYLCPNPRRQIIGFQIIRDILHELYPTAKNKTSRACQRRILYMMKNPATAHSVALHLEDVRQDHRIIQQFDNVIEKLKAQAENVEQLEQLANEKFRELIFILQKKFSPKLYEDEIHELIPDTVSELRIQYEIVYPASSLKKRGCFQDVKNIVDIYCAIVNTMIHSSLCTTTDKTSYTYQLFQVYQQYPDTLLRSAMAKIRADQMVSLKKSYMRLKQKTGNYLPVSSSPYQLSVSYMHILQTKYQHEIFYDSYLMLKNLCVFYANEDPSKSIKIVAPNGGAAAALVELYTKGQLLFEVDIPDQIIILDPRVSDKDKTYARIVQRYRELLRSCKPSDSTSTSAIFNQSYMKLEELNKKNADMDMDDDLDDGDDDDELEELNNMGDEAPCALSQQAAIARAASRIALYMMREELGDSMVAETQHAHDFFVVNSCNVFCRLALPGPSTITVESQEGARTSDTASEAGTLNGNKNQQSSDLLKQTGTGSTGIATATETATNEISSTESDRSKRKNADYTVSASGTLADKQGITVDKYSDSCSVVDLTVGEPIKTSISKNVQHCSFEEVSGRVKCLSNRQIQEVLDEINSNLVVPDTLTSEAEVRHAFMAAGASEADRRKAGDITAFLFSKKDIGATMKELRKEYRKPKTDMSLAEILGLLVKCYKIYRTGVVIVRYVHQTFMKPWLVHSYKLLRLDREKMTPAQQHLAVDVTEVSSKTTEPSGKAQEKIKAWKRRKLLATKKDVEHAVQSLQDSSTTVKLQVAIRPWVKVDGALNRRVLDRLLGSVLGYSMNAPGISIAELGNRFVPALQPFQVRELTEILEKLGCVKLMVVKQSWKTTLFSKPSQVKFCPSDGTEGESRIIVEPQPDAVLRLGEFIGDKAYTKDFLEA